MNFAIGSRLEVMVISNHEPDAKFIESQDVESWWLCIIAQR